jgi:sortase A
VIAARRLGLSYRTALPVGLVLAFSAATASAVTPATSASVTDGREQDVPRYQPVGSADAAIARIEIPRVGISAPILEGVDYKTIRRAVGHFPETPLPSQNGNMALAAHRTSHFWGLRNIRIGDEITITSATGASRYRVERTWVVSPEDVSVLRPSAGRVLTLVTCFPFDYVGSAPQRFIVRAKAEIAAPSPASRTEIAAPPVAPQADTANCPAID